MLTELPGLVVTQGCAAPDTPASPDSNWLYVGLKKRGVLAGGLEPCGAACSQRGTHAASSMRCMRGSCSSFELSIRFQTGCETTDTTDILQVGM